MKSGTAERKEYKDEILGLTNADVIAILHDMLPEIEVGWVD